MRAGGGAVINTSAKNTNLIGAIDLLPAGTVIDGVTTTVSGGTLDVSSYAQLERPSTAVAPMTFGAVAPQLFESVVKAGVAMSDMPDAGATSAAAPHAGN